MPESRRARELYAALEHLLSAPGRQPHLLFETLVLKLLAASAEEDKKELVIEKSALDNVRFDAYAPDGIADIEGPTIIEIVLWRRQTALNRLGVTAERLGRAQASLSIRNVLLVVGAVLTKNERRQIQTQVLSRAAGTHLTLWDWNNLYPLIERYAEYVASVLDLLPENCSTRYES
jgi:hypothetical protein